MCCHKHFCLISTAHWPNFPNFFDKFYQQLSLIFACNLRTFTPHPHLSCSGVRISLPHPLYYFVIIGRWRSSKQTTDSSLYLPDNYFMDLETHWGGCGGKDWSKRYATATKFALGIGFGIVFPADFMKQDKVMY